MKHLGGLEVEGFDPVEEALDADLAAAQRALTAVAKHDPGVGAVIGVDIAGLRAVNVRFTDIAAPWPSAIGLRARDVTASGDFEATRIRATGQAEPPGPLDVGEPDPAAHDQGSAAGLTAHLTETTGWQVMVRAPTT